MFQENRLKRRVAAGEQVYGAWLGLASAAVTELMALVGFDFVIIDQEHGAGSLRDAADMLRACDAAACPAAVRVPWNDHVYLKRILDLGAQSLMIPMVESAEEARSAVAACRYPPHGRRGWAAPVLRCSRYGLVEDYTKRADAELFLMVQIESAATAQRAKEIAAIDGVDMVFIGVNDLAGSIGRLEQLDHPEVDALVRQTEAGVRAAGKPLGTVPSARRDTRGLFEDGYSMVAGSSDAVLLREGARRELAAVRAMLGPLRQGAARPVEPGTT